MEQTIATLRIARAYILENGGLLSTVHKQLETASKEEIRRILDDLEPRIPAAHVEEFLQQRGWK
jgi:hypothetical protein